MIRMVQNITPALAIAIAIAEDSTTGEKTLGKVLHRALTFTA
jgi:hypothetical protein